MLSKKQWKRLEIRWSDADHDLKSVQSITKLPGRREGNKNGPAIAILNQYDNCCFDSPRE